MQQNTEHRTSFHRLLSDSADSGNAGIMKYHTVPVYDLFRTEVAFEFSALPEKTSDGKMSRNFEGHRVFDCGE